MQNQYPQVTEIKETIHSGEVNRLLKDGWVILSLNFVGECPTEEAAICFAYVLGKVAAPDWSAFESHEAAQIREIRAQDAAKQAERAPLSARVTATRDEYCYAQVDLDFSKPGERSMLAGIVAHQLKMGRQISITLAP